MATQLLPVLSQSRHCWVRVGVGVPVQLPVLRVSVCPTVAVPVIDGGVWLAGGVGGAVKVPPGEVAAGVGLAAAAGGPAVGERGGAVVGACGGRVGRVGARGARGGEGG